MPVQPERPGNLCRVTCGQWLCQCHLYADQFNEYEAALQAAKESSVPIQDQERATAIIYTSGQPDIPHTSIKPDTIYGPFTVGYEIQELHYCKRCGAYKSIKCIPCQNSYCGKTTEKVTILHDDTPATKGDLLPCPFCGSQPEWINERLADSHFYIRCPHCHIVMKEDRRDKAIGMWNTRHDTPEKGRPDYINNDFKKVSKSDLKSALREVNLKNKEIRDSYDDPTRLDFRIKDSRGFPTGEVIDDAKVKVDDDPIIAVMRIARMDNLMPIQRYEYIKSQFTITRKQ